MKTDVRRYSPLDVENKTAAYRIGSILGLTLAIPTILICSQILKANGYPTYIAVVFFPIAILTIVLHEMIHAGFQWIYSKKMPEIGFKKPFPYSKLRPNASISKNEGLVSALAPLIFLSIVPYILALFAFPLAQVGLLVMSYLHVLTCTGDIHFFWWLLKNPNNTRLRVDEMTTVVYYD